MTGRPVILFLIVAEALSRMLSKGQQEGIIRGFKVKGMSLPISHIQFTDDTLIFSKAKEDKIINLRSTILCFEEVSGLKVNLAKSKIFGINMEEAELDSFVELFQCPKGKLPSTFVGLPLCIGKIPKSFWNKVIERFGKYLAS